jgi:hypothetical protein
VKPEEVLAIYDWMQRSYRARLGRAGLWRTGDLIGRNTSRLIRRYIREANVKVPAQPGKLESVAGGKYHAVRPPNCFSFLDNPEDSLAFFHRFVGLIGAGTPALHINQSHNTQIDLCAGTLLNILASEAKSAARTRFSGRFPGKHELVEIVLATGLPKLFNVYDINFPHIEVFQPQKGSKTLGQGHVSSPKEVVGDNLVRYLERCFKHGGYDLSISDKQQLGVMIGEVLGNAEQYGAGEWWISGYMRGPSERPYGDCHLTLINFGPSIAETVSKMLPGPNRTEIEELVALHSKTGFFTRGWTEESLWTLYALQEGVSGSQDPAPSSRRGAGLTETLCAFARLGRTTDGSGEPKMCILSGQTYIVINQHTIISEDSGGRRIAALNTQNDLRLPPERAFVSSLPLKFPGTLISVRFLLDPRRSSSKVSFVI